MDLLLQELKGLVRTNIELGSRSRPTLGGLSHIELQSEIEKQRRINIELVEKWNRS